MANPVIMPRQGQSVETCIITQWIKKKGESVKPGDMLFSYETDKASFDVEAQHAGVLLDVFFNDGDEVPVLSNVAVIGQVGEDTKSFRPGIANDQAEVQTQEAPPGIFRISPRARALAAILGIDPCSLTGTGPNGRIIARDVEMSDATHEGQTSRSAPTTGLLEYDDKKVSNVRRIIAKSMHESLSSSAQLTHHLSADVRKLLLLRAQVKAEMEKGSNINITLNDMVCFAVIKAIHKFPEIIFWVKASAVLKRYISDLRWIRRED
jgi:pyruvate dehydrogenase E2 component (dihydrolipoamide acetyltransferase)